MGIRRRGFAISGAATLLMVVLLSASPASATAPPAFVRAWAAVGPAGIATDADGGVFVAEPANSRVVKFDAQGNVLGTRSSGLGNPTAVGVDGAGTLYVLDGGSVARFDASGASLGSWSTGLNTPTDLAVDSAGDVFVLSRAPSGPSKRVSRFSPSGTLATSWGVRLETAAVAVRVDGSQVFTINRHFEVGVTLTEILSTDASGGSPAYLNANASLDTPIGLSTDADGNVYATDLSHKVAQFGPNGAQLTTWGGSGSGDGQFNTPADAARAGDRVFVADKNNNRVQAFTFAAVTTCRGENVSVYLDAGDVPTGADDVILGTAGADTVDALGGDDTVCALDGNDSIEGGTGADELDGGNGADTVSAGDGADHLYGGIGPDLLQGGDGPDVAAAGPGRDRLFGGPKNDGLFGGIGDDALAGNEGDDLCAGGDGTDRAGPSCEFTRGLP